MLHGMLDVLSATLLCGEVRREHVLVALWRRISSVAQRFAMRMPSFKRDLELKDSGLDPDLRCRYRFLYMYMIYTYRDIR